jgi:hypothetical protein
MLHVKFEHLDIGGDGFHDLKRLQRFTLVLHDARASKSDFVSLCEALGADYEKGLSIDDFKLIYT